MDSHNKPPWSYGKHGNNGRYFSIGHSHKKLLVNKSLNNPIPSNYIFSRDKPVGILFKMWQLYLSNFTNVIDQNLVSYSVYTVFIRVRYNKDQYFMAGNQFGFNFSSLLDIKGLFDVVTEKLSDYMEDYNLTDESIVHVELIFRQIDKRLLSEFHLEKPSHVSRFEVIKTEKDLIIPV